MDTHIAQIYQVKGIKTNVGFFDFDCWNALLIHTSDRDALILVTDPASPLSGLFSARKWATENGLSPKDHYDVFSIMYAITAYTDDEPDLVRSQPYVHAFKNTASLDGNFRMTSRVGRLFAEYPLADLVDSPRFGNAIGTQFIG